MVENRSSWWLPMLWRDSINVRIDIQTRLSHGIALHNICSLSSPSCLRRPGDHSESCWSSMVEVIKCERDGISKIRARLSTRLHERSTMVAVATRNSRRCGQEAFPRFLPVSRASALYTYTNGCGRKNRPCKNERFSSRLTEIKCCLR